MSIIQPFVPKSFFMHCPVKTVCAKPVEQKPSVAKPKKPVTRTWKIAATASFIQSITSYQLSFNS